MMWKQEPSLENVCAKQNIHPTQQLKKKTSHLGYCRNIHESMRLLQRDKGNKRHNTTLY